MLESVIPHLRSGLRGRAEAIAEEYRARHGGAYIEEVKADGAASAALAVHVEEEREALMELFEENGLERVPLDRDAALLRGDVAYGHVVVPPADPAQGGYAAFGLYTPDEGHT
jgi:hypothetical protein